MKQTVTVEVPIEMLYFLRQRYNKRSGRTKQPKRLVMLAISEITGLQARKMLEERGYAPIDEEETDQDEQQ